MKNPSKIEVVAVDELIPYVNNARVHSDDQVTQIASSIREFGFNVPILIDAEQGIIAGHGRLMAAKKLGYTEVPCIRLEHLSETQKKAYILADNKIALNSDWDVDLLRLELGELDAQGFNLELTGFVGDDLTEAMFGKELKNNEDGSTKEINPDEYDMAHKCPKCGFEFDD